LLQGSKLSKQRFFLLNKRIHINNSTLLFPSLPKQQFGEGKSIKGVHLHVVNNDDVHKDRYELLFLDNENVYSHLGGFGH
jgi:hypothetical protein